MLRTLRLLSRVRQQRRKRRHHLSDGPPAGSALRDSQPLQAPARPAHHAIIPYPGSGSKPYSPGPASSCVQVGQRCCVQGAFYVARVLCER